MKKITISSMLLLPILPINHCQTRGKVAHRKNSSFIGSVMMRTASEAHVAHQFGPAMKAKQDLYFYRAETKKVRNAYVTKGTLVAEGQVQRSAKDYVVVRAKNIKEGDLAYRKKISQGSITLMYKGRLLKCSKPEELHVFGTAEDGLLPGTTLDVFRFENISEPSFGTFNIEKIKVGRIEVVKRGGANFSIAKTLKGKIEPNDWVELSAR